MTWDMVFFSSILELIGALGLIKLHAVLKELQSVRRLLETKVAPSSDKH
jgi:hypothetical protein